MALHSTLENGKKDKFRVIIVGGSIAGLTLAHALSAKGVDYVLLEAHDTITPDIGASIGFTGNSPRILDQLGLWDDIAESGCSIVGNYAWTEDGRKLAYSEGMKLVEVRFVRTLLVIDDLLLLLTWL